MANKENLIKQLDILAGELETDVDTSELTKADLEEKIATMKEMVKDKKKAEVEAAKEREDDGKKPPFYIADGKSLTSRRGVLAPGAEIKAADLAGGQPAIDEHVKNGFICKGD